MFGAGQLQLINATHAHWERLLLLPLDDARAETTDSVWVAWPATLTTTTTTTASSLVRSFLVPIARKRSTTKRLHFWKTTKVTNKETLPEALRCPLSRGLSWRVGILEGYQSLFMVVRRIQHNVFSVTLNP
jgi:hypothetical protein